ncbi:helix-turn-helix domain-containing protein [Salmonella enterica]|nr:helix-turn-helix domain-containing protein [Salmonella enterica]ELM5565004.1 helix-turn-helix domain-containing protein [Salmonella enterica]
MNLKNYIKQSPTGEAKRLAECLGVSKSYMSQMISGLSAVNPERCVVIEKETAGVVTRRDLRPLDWARIWPDLIPKGAALELEKITNGALKCDLSVYKKRPRKYKRRSSPDTSPKENPSEKA